MTERTIKERRKKERSNLTQFAIMMGQTLAFFGVVALLLATVFVIIIGVAACFAFGGPFFGCILLAFLASLIITGWRWMEGERP